MKKINFFKAVAAVFAITLGISSCSKEEIPSADTDVVGEYVEVSLKCLGEITDIEVSPLSRAGNSDLYFIKAFSCYEIDGQKQYVQYAYGFFDDLSNAKIKLRKDEMYAFGATAVEDGKEVIYKEQIDGGVVYYRPFMCFITNGFVYNNDFTEGYMYYGTADMYEENGEMVTYNIPPVKRHFGTAENFIAQEGTSVTIDMAPMTFGLKVVAENLTEGSVKVKTEGAPEIVLNSGEESKTLNLSVYYVSSAYWDDYKADYQEGQDKWWEGSVVTVTWTDSQGIEHNVGEREVKYHRNMIKTIRVRLPQNSVQGNAEISTEE